PTAVVIDRIDRVLSGLELLESVTGVPGLVGRCVVPDEVSDGITDKPEVWRSAAVPGYHYRFDVSKDQYSGLVFGLVAGAVLLDGSDTIALRQRCREFLVRCARHLDAGDLRIRQRDGRVVRFGDLRGRILGVPIGVHAAIALPMFRAWARFSESRTDRRRAAIRTEELIGDLEPLHVELFGIRKYSNALMGAAGMASLSIVETDPAWRRVYRRAFVEFIRDFAGEGNAFFHSIARNLDLGDGEEEERCMRNLWHARLGFEFIEVSEDRFDGVPRRWIPGRRWQRRSAEALPLAVRPQSTFCWRTDPYDLRRDDGAAGELIASGADLFCAYWFGRYTGWIPGPSESQ
ncbi:MAG: hypothetical protein KDC38_20365, partial [Planctomycetes bacterium]|nr:hypothetical protein [Planctomycetota bacterium]